LNKLGKLIVVSGPSGAGKSSLLKKLLAKYEGQILFSVSYTSREKRVGEEDGIDYNFISKSEFEDKIKNNVFLEWAIVHNNYYGTSSEYIKNIVDKGIDCILDIDVQGGLNLMSKMIDAIYIFIAPPSIDTLKERLIGRATDSIEVINRRVENAKKEILEKDKYQHIIINDNFDEAFDKLEKIIYNDYSS
jgi:guanylate kinase